MKTFEFTGNDLMWCFRQDELERLGNELIVKRICETQQLDFNKCSNIRIINEDWYSPRIAFDYNE